MTATTSSGDGSGRPAPARTVWPTIEIRFSPVFAWMLIGFGAIFLVLALFLGRKAPSLGIFISIAALAAMVGGNYWRQHLHVVARMTPRHLMLRRWGTMSWPDIAQVDKKVLNIRYRGSSPPEYVCIKLKVRRNTRDGVFGFLDKVQTQVLGGYDAILSRDELSCTVDWFVAECHKRMAAVTDAPAGPVAEPRRAG